MRIRWTVPAADDLQSIKNYLQQNGADSINVSMKLVEVEQRREFCSEDSV
jgi:hypothetical protein